MRTPGTQGLRPVMGESNSPEVYVTLVKAIVAEMVIAAAALCDVNEGSGHYNAKTVNILLMTRRQEDSATQASPAL